MPRLIIQFIKLFSTRNSLIVFQQFLIKINSQSDFINRYILVISVNRSVLLRININRRKPDNGIRKIGKSSRIRSGRKNKRSRSRIIKNFLNGFSDVFLSITVKRIRSVIFIIRFAESNFNIIFSCNFFHCRHIFFKIQIIYATQKSLASASAVRIS